MTKPKLGEAIREMNPGDLFRTKLDNWYIKSEKGFLYPYSDVEKKQVGYNVLGICENTMDLEGKIIRVEPKVLTTLFYMRKMYHDDPAKMENKDIKSAFWDGDNNGQIKESIRIKPFIDCIGDNIESLANDGYDSIVEYYRNHKPLNTGPDIHKRTVPIDSSIDHSGSHH